MPKEQVVCPSCLDEFAVESWIDNIVSCPNCNGTYIILFDEKIYLHDFPQTELSGDLTIDVDDFGTIADEVAQEWRIPPSDKLYFNYALEVAERYIRKFKGDTQ